MHDSDHAAQLAGALHERLVDVRFPLTEPVEREIRLRVWEYSDELKSLGFPPERVIIAVKRAANDAGVYSSSKIATPTAHLEGKDKLLVDMVGWCIARYFGTVPRDG